MFSSAKQTRPIGPLSMYPPVEDNYGTEACHVTCLHTKPPTLVIATAEGKLHHCCVLPRNSKSSVSDVTHVTHTSLHLRELPDFLQRAPGLPDLPTSDAQQVLYVYETVELELAMTTPELPDFDDLDPDQVEAESFSCNIKILKG